MPQSKTKSQEFWFPWVWKLNCNISRLRKAANKEPYGTKVGWKVWKVWAWTSVTLFEASIEQIWSPTIPWPCAKWACPPNKRKRGRSMTENYLHIWQQCEANLTTDAACKTTGWDQFGPQCPTWDTCGSLLMWNKGNKFMFAQQTSICPWKNAIRMCKSSWFYLSLRCKELLSADNMIDKVQMMQWKEWKRICHTITSHQCQNTPYRGVLIIRLNFFTMIMTIIETIVSVT